MIDDGRIEGAYPELNEIVSDVQLKMAEATEAFCIQKMIDLNIDPDVVQLQALEIQRLRGLLQEREWIPVSVRLPEEPEKNPEFENKKLELYLVCVTGHKYPFRALWNGEFFSDGFFQVSASAWMSLPEAYKGE